MGAPLTPAQQSEAGALPNLKIHASHYRLEWMDDPWDDVRRAGAWLLRLAEELQPDLIHLNGYAHGALPWRAPVLLVGHSCVLSWWRAVKGEAAPPRWQPYQRQIARGLAAANCVVAPTQAMLAALAQHYGPLPAARAIANGREPQAFRPGRKLPLLFSAGRLWDEAKNIAALEQIAPALPWPVFVAGENQHPDGQRLSLKHSFALGHLAAPELAAWLARAAIYVLPARYEPFGLSALEAALAGCALVLGDIPSLREVWGEAAVFVPPNDRAALKTALLELIHNPFQRRQLAARARRHAFQFTPRRMAAAYLATYEQLLAPRPGAVQQEEARACAS
jgi:glycosyltransferase involved in cell wall biosynthesis